MGAVLVSALTLRMKMKKIKVDRGLIEKSISDSAETVASLVLNIDEIAAISSGIIAALKAGRKILTAGNGGSAAEALHFAEELTGRFKADRVALPAIALTADCTALTCIANDYGFDAIFSRQVEAYGRKGDMLVLFTTSGNSRNLVYAQKAARSRQMKTVCLLGKTGGALAGTGDYEVIVKSFDTARVQETHQVILHLILDAIEQAYT